MKKVKQIILAASLFFVSLSSYSYNSPKGWWRCDKDIEYDMSGYSAYAATVFYNDRLFNFVNYNDNVGNSYIIVRNITNNLTKSNVFDNNFKRNQREDYTPFKNHSVADQDHEKFQPAPVVYKGNLYLFFYDHDLQLSYSAYNPAIDDLTNNNSQPWGTKTKVDISVKANGMAASEVDGKLVIVCKDDDENAVYLIWSEDLIHWEKQKLDWNNSGDSDDTFASFSAITIAKRVLINGTYQRQELMMIGYLENGTNHAECKAYKFNESAKNFSLENSWEISSNYPYQSVALCEGTVYGDDSSTGNCVQAFLKREKDDDGLARRRILRCQLKDLGANWTMPEDNIVDKNYNWADKNGLNLTVANYGKPEYNIDGKTTNKNIVRIMCLVYRGYDLVDHPLNVAHAKTDRYVYLESKSAYIDSPENTHYIGYIEGPPPFVLNRQTIAEPYFFNSSAISISSADFGAYTKDTQSTEYKFTAGIEVEGQFGWFKGELTALYQGMYETTTEFEVTAKIGLEASAEKEGLYLVTHPLVTREHYKVVDWKSTIVDSSYYFHITKVDLGTIKAELKGGLVPSDPETYFSRGKDFSSFPGFASESSVPVTWRSSSPMTVNMASKAESKNEKGCKLDLGFGVEKTGVDKDNKLYVGFKGSFDFKSTVTAASGIEIGIASHLNEPDTSSTNVTDLLYTVYWITPSSDNAKNWWMPEGVTGQSPWCLTYEVNYVKYKGGKIIGSPEGIAEDLQSSLNSNREIKGSSYSQTESPVMKSILYQNYPNPFSSSTRIKYQVGDNVSATDRTGISSPVRLTVYDINGKAVATLVDEVQEPGSYEIDWDASQMPRGLYFYSLQSRDFKDVKKLILMK